MFGKIAGLALLGMVACPVAWADDGATTTVPFDATNFLHDSTHALVAGPTGYSDPSLYPGFLSTVDSLYLEQMGFDSGAKVDPLIVPDSFSYGQSVALGEQDMVDDVLDDLGCTVDVGCTATTPLTIFADSQSAVDLSLAEQTLNADGVTPDMLHIVMVADTANAFTGFLDTWAAPGSLGAELLDLIGWGNLLGVQTPDEYFPTIVYTLPGDYFGDYPDADSFAGTIIHTDYLGLTAQEIASATLTNVDGMTDYYSIADPVNVFETAWQAILNTYF